jgi:uncharacterized NAD(P)/FAD-binding protein YdhS
MGESAIAIVGGGCSGLLVAVQLLRGGCRAPITIIDPAAKLGRGLAYGTPFDSHLLNVPAGKMSALPDNPGHFLEWLRARRRPHADGAIFAPRKTYGEYLEETLRDELTASGNRHFKHVRAEALSIRIQPNGALVILDRGEPINAEKVVLALGNPAAGPPSVSSARTEGRQYRSPWIGDALRRPYQGERILLVGTGLTAVDSVLALQGQQPECNIWMLSRRGILPQVHNPRLVPAAPPQLSASGNALAIFRELRAAVAAFREMDLCWRNVVDALRPVSNQMWADLPLADKQRFLRHLKTYWETHRHRMAPEIHRRLDLYREQGRLHVLAGRLREANLRNGAGRARISLRGGGERLLEIDRMIDCTGIHENYGDKPRPFIASLIADRLATPNDLGIGFRTDRHGGLVDAEMRPSRVLFTLGPPRRGELFETTAVPEIRVQAAELARHLLG